MSILFLILGAIAILAGIIGCILPLLPGPPVAWLGLLLLHFSKYAHISWRLLIITAIITILIILLDYFMPVWATKKFGGTKAGQRGAAIGIIAGLFIGPWGIIIGPLAGAFIGEMIAAPKEGNRAMKAAIGSFIGFLMSMGIRLIWCVLLAWWFVKALV
ncbi:MAG TPA: DUF456 domain-containing protein [Arachidicoccus soli]|jgi:uncharacterized protein YqgC (DUF456 family)|nr:MAG: DUF456 domain-containing protein [Chitinophagaceae bacterium]HEU0227394.1 DUF456 domain-containing protein [Arachidicoccus soli]